MATAKTQTFTNATGQVETIKVKSLLAAHREKMAAKAEAPQPAEAAPPPPAEGQ